jgi:hypothetical protein
MSAMCIPLVFAMLHCILSGGWSKEFVSVLAAMWSLVMYQSLYVGLFQSRDSIVCNTGGVAPFLEEKLTGFEME